ncbi:Thioesterase/thiol ester dehydrase-isomerase [Ramaria rubella]|nr:Thioesterase/thiol ester dehydrase-isomerase [Ramaria rubella]
MSTSSIRNFLSRAPSWRARPVLIRDITDTGKLRVRSHVETGQRCNRFYSTTARLNATGGRTIKLSYAIAAATLLCSTTYLLGLFAPPTVFRLLNPRPAPAAPAADSEEGKEYTEKIERELLNLEALKRCRESQGEEEWYETRPHFRLDPARKVNHLTAGALRGPGKLAVAPLVRAKTDETEAWVFLHLGRGVCGHDGVVHGGLLATLLDEGCARNAVLAFPSRICVTANLNVDYKAPTFADQFVIMKTKLIEIKGRKAIVQGQIEDLKGNILAQAKSIFVEPKIAGALNSTVAEAMFPSTKQRIAHMAGTRDSLKGGGQIADDGVVVEGK